MNPAFTRRGRGIDLDGAGHIVSRNVVQNNAHNGFLTMVMGSRFDRNQTRAHGGFGMEDTSAGHGTAGRPPTTR